MRRGLVAAAAKSFAAAQSPAAGFASANAGGSATVERALSSLFASTSGRAEAAADRLSAIPARVRALINSKRLDDALLQLARIDARAELRSAVHSARATYQRRIASIQRELRKDHADLIRAQLAAPRLVALCNGLQYSSGGQRIMRVGVPLAALAYAGTDAARCDAAAEPYRPRVALPPPLPEHRLLMMRAVDALADELLTMLRAVYLVLLFVPACTLAPLCAGLDVQREAWLRLVLWTLERAGPAFIKWGQWAATRPDMFPGDLCDALAVLQTSAPQHSWHVTRATVEHAFGRPLEVVFNDFGRQPVASGSIAQIHKATLSEWGAAQTGKPAGTVVAVKVRHPGVSTMMQRDFVLMQRAAALSAKLPVLRDLNLEESVRQFGAPLREQLDLSSEAGNLARFNRNFRKWKNLSFPEPIFPLITTDVLVESFEEGQLISRYVNNPGNPHNVKLAGIGLDSYLKMLLKDNFIHADLHPGNILVRMDRPDPASYWGRLAQRLDLSNPEHMVLLDVGMVAELTADDQAHLVQFFKALSHKDGKALGLNILDFSDERHTCPEPQRFVAQMETYFNGLTWHEISADTSGVIADMMEILRKNQVALKGVVSTVVVTTLVLEGWSSKLNPDIKIMDKLQELLPLSYSERVSKFISEFGSDREVVPSGL